MSENISVLEFVFVLVSLYTHTRKILVIVHSLSLSSTLPITVTRFLPVTDNDPSYVYCFLRCPCVVVAVVPFLPAAVAARSTFYSSLHVKKVRYWFSCKFYNFSFFIILPTILQHHHACTVSEIIIFLCSI